MATKSEFLERLKEHEGRWFECQNTFFFLDTPPRWLFMEDVNVTGMQLSARPVKNSDEWVEMYGPVKD